MAAWDGSHIGENLRDNPQSRCRPLGDTGRVVIDAYVSSLGAALHGPRAAKRELLTEVWRLPYGGPDKTVDVHLSWLRRKLGETAQDVRYLHAVRGVGVRLSAPGE